jgi:hypothetical protein
MRKLNWDSFPHVIDCLNRIVARRWHIFWSYLAARWWGVRLGADCVFLGRPLFRRYPGSQIVVGTGCEFRSSSTSNLIGVNHPCIVATLKEKAKIEIGAGCGFSGTAIACSIKIELGNNIWCGANTLIMDTDWHTDDPRTGSDAPVTICDNVWLGVNVIVLKGVTIGENTLIGAGSVVTRSLPAGVVAAGVPARILKKISVADLDMMHTQAR